MSYFDPSVDTLLIVDASYVVLSAILGEEMKNEDQKIISDVSQM